MENIAWFGRAAAIIEQWDWTKGVMFGHWIQKFGSSLAPESNEGRRQIMVMLNQAWHDLRMRTIGPISTAIAQGGVFDYYDIIRKVIELASEELFFVDPYLDAEFISRYVPNVHPGVVVRLLTGNNKLATLLPAVDLFSRQNDCAISVRSTTGLHDRYMFVDGKSCYQSGASFKDGARLAPTTLMQITDAFDAVWQTYDGLWNKAKVER